MHIGFGGFFLQCFDHIRMRRKIRAANAQVNDLFTLPVQFIYLSQFFARNNIRLYLPVVYLFSFYIFFNPDNLLFRYTTFIHSIYFQFRCQWFYFLYHIVELFG